MDPHETAVLTLVYERRIRCSEIAEKARLMGFDVTWRTVSRQYKIWERWYQGRLATGYLIRQTGVRRKQP